MREEKSIIYISDDGVSFISKKECAEYEDRFWKKELAEEVIGNFLYDVENLTHDEILERFLQKMPRIIEVVYAHLSYENKPEKTPIFRGKNPNDRQ